MHRNVGAEMAQVNPIVDPKISEASFNEADGPIEELPVLTESEK